MIERRIIKREGQADLVEVRVVKDTAPNFVVVPEPEPAAPAEDEGAEDG